MACLKIFSLKRKDKSHSYSPREIELKYNSDFAFKPRPLASLLRLEPSDTRTRRIECADVEYGSWYPNPLDPTSLVCDVELEMLRFQGTGASRMENGNTNNSGNTGVINYNFYSNSYTDAVDLSGAMSSQESNAAENAASGPTSLLKAGINAAAKIGPLLAEPNFEEYKMSDRVDIIHKGTSTIITQNSVGSNTYTSCPKSSITSVADESTSGGPAVSRFVTLKAQSWTPAKPVYAFQVAHLPYALVAQNTPFKSLLSKHQLMKCCWIVQVQANTTRFHGGCLGVFAIPEFNVYSKLNGLTNDYTNNSNGEVSDVWDKFANWHNPDAMYGAWYYKHVYESKDKHWYKPEPKQYGGVSPQSLFCFPHQLINPRTNSSATLCLPFVDCGPITDVTVHCPWAIVVVVLRELTVATGGTPSVDINVSVAPCDVEFHGLRQNSMYQGPIPKIDIDASKALFSSTQPYPAPPVYGKIPASSPAFMPGEFFDYVQLAQIPSLVKDREIRVTSSDRTDPIFHMPLRPTDTQTLNTMLGSVTRMFTQWRGSIVIRCVFVGNQMQNCRILLAWTPQGFRATHPTKMEDAMQGHYVIYDTGIDSSVDLVIPYVAPYDFTPVRTPYTRTELPPTGDANRVLVDTPYWSRGYITIWQYTNLASPPNSPSQADFLLFVFAGEDYVLKGPSNMVASYQGDESSPLQPAETGCDKAMTDSASNENPTPLAVESIGSSRVDFFWNRYFHVVTIPKVSSVDPQYIRLNISDILSDPVIRQSLHATYLRCGISVAVRAMPANPSNTECLDGLTINMLYVPPGSSWAINKIDQTMAIEQAQDSTGNYALPSFTWKPNQTPVFTCSIPYVSFTTVLPTAYSGFETTSSIPKRNNQIPQDFGYGMLVLRPSMPPTRELVISAWVKFNNVRLFCPRPGIHDDASYSNDSTSIPGTETGRLSNTMTTLTFQGPGATNFSLLKQAGDVEENPGPSLSKLYQILRDPAVDALCEAYDELKKFKEQATNLLDSFSGDSENPWLNKFIKYLGYAILAWKSLHDPMTAAAVCFIIGSDVTAFVVSKLAKHLKKFAKTDPPPVPKPRACKKEGCCCGNKHNYPDELNPFSESGFWSRFKKGHFQGPMQDVSSLINILKGAEWIYHQFEKVIKWLKTWRTAEYEVSSDFFQAQMKDYPHYYRKYKECANNYRHPDRAEVAEYFRKMRKCAAHVNPRLMGMFPEFDPSPPDPTRPEPVVVVLRGAPGQGKSVCSEMLARMLSYTLVGKSSYYAFNSATKHFDGYKQQAVTIIDDLGQDTSGDDFRLFCQLVSTTECIVPMADLPDKGMHFKSEILIANTNLPSFNPITVSDPTAIKRRIFLDLTVEANRAYTKPDGTLDLVRALQPTGKEPQSPLLRQDHNILYADCVAFKHGKYTLSFLEVFDMIKRELQRRQNVSNSLTNLFTFQGPSDDSWFTTFYKKWNLRAKENSEEKLILELIRYCHGSDMLKEYCQLAAANKEKKTDYWNMVRIIEEILAALTLILSLISIMIVMYQLFFQGPYETTATKPAKPNRQSLLKLVEMQGPKGQANMEMERTLMKKNIVEMTYEKHNGRFQTTTVLFVRDRIFLINTHILTGIKNFHYENTEIPAASVQKVQAIFDGHPSDVTAVQFTVGRQYRDITSNFINSLPNPGTPIVGLMKTEGSSYMWSGECLPFKNTMNTYEGCVPHVLPYKAVTAHGYCGSVMVADAGVWKGICGIHSLGDGAIGAATVLSRQHLLNLLEGFLEFQGKIYDVQKADFVYTPTKTSLKPTFVCVDPKLEPAALSHHDPRLKDPENFKAVILSKHVGDSLQLPWGIRWASYKYAERIRAMLPPDFLEPLSVREAVEGIDGLDPMDMDKSPGLPYVKKGLRRTDLWNPKTGPTIELMAEINRYLDYNYDKHVFLTFLKDELRPKEKVQAGKTRVIDVAGFGHAIVGRMLFGRLFAFFHKNPGWNTGSAVGVNPDLAWTQIFYTAPSRNVLAMDYSGFDASHTSGMFCILKHFLTTLGYGTLQLSYIDSLCYSKHHWDDETYRLDGGLPSGCSGTTIFNTIMNNIVARAAASYAAEGPVGILCYGDDILVSSPEKFPVSDWLEFFSKTPYKVTAADKSEQIDWRDITQCTFLKRGFVLDGSLVRPVMDEQHLAELLKWARPGTLQAKLLSIAQLAFHLPRQAYDRLMLPFEEAGYEIPCHERLNEEWREMFI
uniref:Genome polyprotein n=2 Tax=Teschovirus A TaxID=118140 RepID=A0A291S6S7_9PICO|nr:polyprotein [teschovirus A2]